MIVHRLTRADYRRMPWRNGGGWTTEIARSPADGDAFDWRLSIAEIATDGPFSSFTGCARSLVLLEGAGIELRIDGAPRLADRRGQVVDFDGDAPVHCRLLDGPSRCFNAISRRGRVTHQALFRPLVGPMVLFAESGVDWLVHVVAGRVHEQHAGTNGARAEAGDTLWISPDGERRQVVLAGGGEVLLVRLGAVDPAGTPPAAG
jgi:environmental stress-induced protein Ves